jgi:hypothetical protein
MPHIEPLCNKFNPVPEHRNLPSLLVKLVAIEHSSNKDFADGKTGK